MAKLLKFVGLFFFFLFIVYQILSLSQLSLFAFDGEPVSRRTQNFSVGF